MIKASDTEDFRELRDCISEQVEYGHFPAKQSAAFVVCSVLLKDFKKVLYLIEKNKDKKGNSKTDEFIAAIKNYNKGNIIDGDKLAGKVRNVENMHAEMRILAMIAERLKETKIKEYDLQLMEDEKTKFESGKLYLKAGETGLLCTYIDDSGSEVKIEITNYSFEGVELTKEILDKNKPEILELADLGSEKYENYIGISKLCCLDCHAIIYGVNHADNYNNNIEIRGAHNVKHSGNWTAPFNITGSTPNLNAPTVSLDGKGVLINKRHKRTTGFLS